MGTKKTQIRNSTAEFLVFTSQAGESGIEVRVDGETVWLTQKLIAALFAVDVRTVSEHLQNILASGELKEAAVIRKFRNTASDGKRYLTAFYNLDAIIAVGIKALDRFVTMVLDYAEDQATRAMPMTMADWAKKLDAFLQFNERDLLDHPGKVTAAIAKAFAEGEFEKYRVIQDRLFESDFDRAIKQLPKEGGTP